MRNLRRGRKRPDQIGSASCRIECASQNSGKWWSGCTGWNFVHHIFTVSRMRQANHASENQACSVPPLISNGRRYSFSAQYGCGSDPAATAVRNEIISRLIETPAVWLCRKDRRIHPNRRMPHVEATLHPKRTRSFKREAAKKVSFHQQKAQNIEQALH